jgi:hypothetical protein
MLDVFDNSPPTDDADAAFVRRSFEQRWKRETRTPPLFGL